ncbi:hypothetical protein ACFLZE_03700 [Thermodesulfobacteriota bacterium]
MINVRRLIFAAVTVLLLGALLTNGFHSFAAAQNKSKTAINEENVSELPTEMADKVSVNCCRASMIWSHPQNDMREKLRARARKTDLLCNFRSISCGYG